MVGSKLSGEIRSQFLEAAETVPLAVRQGQAYCTLALDLSIILERVALNAGEAKGLS